jgi:CHAT domain-containing protein/tetratricopeptide (TPR) repeat protein
MSTPDADLAQTLLNADSVPAALDLAVELREQLDDEVIAYLASRAAKDGAAQACELLIGVARIAGRPDAAVNGLLYLLPSLATDEADEALNGGLLDARRLLAQGDANAPALFCYLTTILAHVERAAGRPEDAVRRLARLRTEAKREGWLAAAVAAATDIGAFALSDARAELAESYALEASWECEGIEPEQIEQLVAVINEIAMHRYYADQAYDSVAQLAEASIRLAPGEPDGEPPGQEIGQLLFILSALRLEHFEDALPGAELMLAREPERVGMLLNRIVALQGLDRHEEADQALEHLRALAPERIEVHALLARSFERREAWDDAAAECVAAVRAYLTGDSRHGPNGLIDQGAAVVRIRRAQGALRLALGDLAPILDSRDVVARHVGLRLRAQVEGELGEAERAVEDLTLSLELLDSPEARLERVELLAELGRGDETEEDFAVLVESDAGVQRIAELLTSLLTEDPSWQAGRRLRGRLRSRSLQFVDAEEDLSVALEIEPGDQRARLWRGINRLTSLPEAADFEEWNQALGARLLPALEDLGRVALEGEEDTKAEALAAYRWLVDRLRGTSPPLDGLLHAMADEPTGMHSVIEGLQAVTVTLGRAKTLDFARRYAEALPLYLQARDETDAVGLPLEVARLDMRIADILLLLREPQQALDRLDQGDELVSLASLPLTANLQQVSRKRRDEAARVGDHAVTFELEFMIISINATRPYIMLGKLLRAEAFGLLGDSVSALEALGDVDALIDMLREAPEGMDVIAAVLRAAKVLREADELDGAATVLATAETFAKTDFDRARIHMAHGNLLLYRHEIDAASSAYDAAEANAHDLHVDFSVALATNRGSIELLRSKPQKTLDHLDSVQLELAARPVFERMRSAYIRAQALRMLDRGEEALATIEETAPLAQTWRADVRAPDLRVFGQDLPTQLGRLHAGLAVDADDAAAAQAALRRTKAQVLSEQISSMPATNSATIADLREIEARIDQERSALVALLESSGPTGNDGIDWELVDRIDGRGLLTGFPDHPALDRAVTLERLQNAERRIGTIRARIDALPETPPSIPTRTEADDRLDAVIVEYFVEPERVTVLVQHPGATPQMSTCMINSEHLAGLAERILQADPEPWLRLAGPWHDDALAALVAPLLSATRPGEHIVVIPDETLHHLPLHAVTVDGVTLGERNPISYAPSLAVLELCRRNHRRSLVSAVVVADSRQDLAHARLEGKAVAARFGATEMSGSEATKDAVLVALAARPDVVHLACHGVVVTDDPASCGIQLAGGGERDNAVIDRAADLTAAEIGRLSLAPQLVTLSACSSGVSTLRPGDEPFGLTRAWLIAGANAIVSTLWPVDDVSTWLLVDRLYTLLGPGAGSSLHTKAQALKEAQKHVRELTSAELVEICEAALAQSPATAVRERTMLSLTKARALRSVHRDADAELLLDRQATFVRALTRRGDADDIERERESPQSYDERPFAHPFFWAGIVLHGDWR